MQTIPDFSNEINPEQEEPQFFVDIHARLRTMQNPSSLSKIGIWHEGATSWVGDASWQVKAAFSKTASSVVSQAYHKQWNLNMTVLDRAPKEQLGCIRTITIKNESNFTRHVKLLLHQLPLSQNEGIAFYSPQEKALIHHSQDVFSLFSLQMPCAHHIQHGAGHLEQNWNDREGKLFFSPFSATCLESVIAASCTLEAGQSYKAQGWLLGAQSLPLLKRFHQKLQMLPF